MLPLVLLYSWQPFFSFRGNPKFDMKHESCVPHRNFPAQHIFFNNPMHHLHNSPKWWHSVHHITWCVPHLWPYMNDEKWSLLGAMIFLETLGTHCYKPASFYPLFDYFKTPQDWCGGVASARPHCLSRWKTPPPISLYGEMHELWGIDSTHEVWGTLLENSWNGITS